MTTGQQWAYALLGATAAFILASVALAVREAALSSRRDYPSELLLAAFALLVAAFVGLTGLIALGLGGVEL